MDMLFSKFENLKFVRPVWQVREDGGGCLIVILKRNIVLIRLFHLFFSHKYYRTHTEHFQQTTAEGAVLYLRKISSSDQRSLKLALEIAYDSTSKYKRNVKHGETIRRNVTQRNAAPPFL